MLLIFENAIVYFSRRIALGIYIYYKFLNYIVTLNLITISSLEEKKVNGEKLLFYDFKVD